MYDPGIGNLRVAEIEVVEFRQALQMPKPRVRDPGVIKTEVGEFSEPTEMREAAVGDLNRAAATRGSTSAVVKRYPRTVDAEAGKLC